MMRNLSKLAKPEVLIENAQNWTAEYLAEPDDATKKGRYRHPAIKKQIQDETKHKCIYCESKIGHNCYGDIEHKIPSKAKPELRFEWVNLTLSCEVCNTRKGMYYNDDPTKEFLDPYNPDHDVEQLLVHLGPMVVAAPNALTAELTIATLKLNCNEVRRQLISRKIEHVRTVARQVHRFLEADDPRERTVARIDLLATISKDAEYSAMSRGIIHEMDPNLLADLEP